MPERATGSVIHQPVYLDQRQKGIGLGTLYSIVHLMCGWVSRQRWTAVLYRSGGIAVSCTFGPFRLWFRVGSQRGD